MPYQAPQTTGSMQKRKLESVWSLTDQQRFFTNTDISAST